MNPDRIDEMFFHSRYIRECLIGIYERRQRNVENDFSRHIPVPDTSVPCGAPICPPSETLRRQASGELGGQDFRNGPLEVEIHQLLLRSELPNFED